MLVRHMRQPAMMRLVSEWWLAKWRPTKRRLTMKRHVWRRTPSESIWPEGEWGRRRWVVRVTIL